ncbi:fimbrial protein [Providencia rustigianii]|uniref:fimbrial protein n=1 Tax=Providencia rustigianii TaxID=158850 RepID=UPI000F6C1CF4|nr:fimbrial protein [Providencia rustigianii]MTC61465.1 fimbrial protein [Providencia rustigianii]VEH56753.1 putative fimbrial subunit SteE [Providencia rustigianii]
MREFIFEKLIYRVFIVFLINILLVLSVKSSTLVTFKGNLIGNPPCDISGENDPIQINFGEVGITRIDGSNYLKDFILNINCSNELGNNVALFIAYKGMNAASFDNNAVQTSLSGLGIRLYYEGHVIPPNDDNIPIVMSSGGVKKIPLSAVPVRDLSVDLFEKPFTAMGTIEIRYP